MNVKIIMLAVAVAVIGAGALMMADDSEAAAGDVLASGSCGTNLTYEVKSLNADDSQVEVVISGSGTAMSDWDSGSVPWYSYRTMIVGATLPDGLTSIGKYAFTSCSSLALTSLPDGLTSIGSYAFSGCRAMALTSLPDGLTSIGSYAFNNCSSLALTSLPDGLTSIGKYAFSGCSAMALTSLPDGLTSIEEGAFNGCFSIKNLTMPAIALSTDTKLNSLETLTYSTTGEVWTASNVQYSPQYLSRTNLQSITFADDHIPSFALYGQTLDRLTITNASGADFLGIYTAPNVKATASALTVDGTAAQIVRLGDATGSAQLTDSRISASDVVVDWSSIPDGYVTGTAAPDILVYPAGYHTREPNDYGAWMTTISILLIVGLIMALILPMIARRWE